MSEQLSNIQPVVGAHPTVTQAAEQAMEAFEHRPGHNVVGRRVFCCVHGWVAVLLEAPCSGQSNK